MAVDADKLKQIPESMQKPIEKYTNLIQELATHNALSLSIYGSIVSGGFDPGRHSARNVLVLEKIDLSLLRRISEHGSRLGRDRIMAPIIMTPGYIKASLDTFALELLEIQQYHLTLFGEDHFTDLTFEEPHVRHQCERELKTSLIAIRQGLLAAAGRNHLIAELEINVAEGLSRTLRGILWLNGQKEAKPMDLVLTEIEKLADRQLSGIRTALDPSQPHGWEQLTPLYDDIEALGKIVDAW
jgi:hypothetical protein